MTAPPRDGATLDSAIVIATSDPSEGIAAETTHIHRMYGTDVEYTRQLILHEQGRTYDVVCLLVGGREEKVYFDVSSFFTYRPPRNPWVSPR